MSPRTLWSAAALAAALLLSAAKPAEEKKAPAPKRTAEGAADLLEKAHNLSLQKDRTQAISILVAGIRRENPNSANAKELRAALADIGGLFFGDKTQQLFELALSLRKNDPAQAQAKLSEALRLEPDNVQLLTESVRLQILRGECSAAGETAAKHRKWNPFDEQLLLVAAQAAVCQGDWPAYAALRSQTDPRKGSYPKTWAALEVERAYREKATARGKEALDALKKNDPEHPEIPFWTWKLETDRSRQRAMAQRYVAGCKNLSAAQFRRYILEVFLCRRTAEAAALLDGNP